MVFFNWRPPSFSPSFLSVHTFWSGNRVVLTLCWYMMRCLNSTSTSLMEKWCGTPLPPLLLHGPGQITTSSRCQDHLLKLVLAQVPYNLNNLDSLPFHSYHTQSNLRSLFVLSVFVLWWNITRYWFRTTWQWLGGLVVFQQHSRKVTGWVLEQ